MKKSHRRTFINCLFEQCGRLVCVPEKERSNWVAKNPLRVSVEEVLNALRGANVPTLHGICYGQKQRITVAALRPLEELLKVEGVLLYRIDIGASVCAERDKPGIIVARPLPLAYTRLKQVSTAQILHGHPLLPLEYNKLPDNIEPEQNFGWLRGRVKVKTAPYVNTGVTRRTSRRLSPAENPAEKKSDKVAFDFKCYSVVRHMTQQAQARQIFKNIKKKAHEHNRMLLPKRREGREELDFAAKMHRTFAGTECERFLQTAKQRIEVILPFAVINCASRAASSAPHDGDKDLGADVCPVFQAVPECSALVKHILTIARVSSPCTSTYQPNLSPLCYPKPTS